jgi:hypothetical protein
MLAVSKPPALLLLSSVLILSGAASAAAAAATAAIGVVVRLPPNVAMFSLAPECDGLVLLFVSTVVEVGIGTPDPA